MGEALKNRPIAVIGNDEFGPAIAGRIAACRLHTLYTALPGSPSPIYGDMLEPLPTPSNLAVDCPIVLAAIEDTETFRMLFVDDAKPGSGIPLQSGSVLVDLGARTPDELQALLGRLDARGIALVDAALIGGPEAAAEGRGKILLGGNDAAVVVAETVLSLLGHVERTGPLGSAHAAAALMGYIEAAHAVAREEAIALGAACGLTAETLTRVLSDETLPHGLNVVQLARRAALARRIARDRGGSADIIDLAAARSRRENR
jgi:3-hydroxyisobutyrate dehydrogenase